MVAPCRAAPSTISWRNLLESHGGASAPISGCHKAELKEAHVTFKLFQCVSLSLGVTSGFDRHSESTGPFPIAPLRLYSEWGDTECGRNPPPSVSVSFVRPTWSHWANRSFIIGVHHNIKTEGVMRVISPADDSMSIVSSMLVHCHAPAIRQMTPIDRW